jgi:hypothetical protein
MTLRTASARSKQLLALVAFLFAMPASPALALACAGPNGRVFPTCEISTPRADERVTVIYAHGGKGLSSVALGSDDLVTEVVDVEIEAAEKPHYIALSSGKPIVWRFTGRVDTISRVVVFGSQLAGATHAGIVGIGRDRILFTKADFEGFKKIPGIANCISGYNACDLSTYFAIPRAARMELAGPEPAQQLHVDQFVEHFSAGIIRIPADGWIEAPIPNDRAPNRDTAMGRHEWFFGSNYIKSSQAYERGLIRIDARSVVSQEEVRDYRTLPAAAGIKQLLDSGALVAAGTPQFRSAYEKWNESYSRLYRSRFDPNFSFNYHVDYLITQPVRLPAALATMSFLVAEGLEAPQLARDNYLTCLFFADRRELNLDRSRERDPRCDSVGTSSALPGPQKSLAYAVWSLDRMKRWSEPEKERCRMFSLSDSSALFVGIAAENVGRGKPGGPDFLRRQVDVIVERTGKIAFYFETWGRPVDWHIKPSPGSEIIAVLLGNVDFPGRSQSDAVHGLESSVPVQSIRAQPGSDAFRNQCHDFNPSRHAHLGGPAALASDEGLKILAGRGLDRLLRATDDGTWPPLSADGPRLTFVIE